MCTRVRCLRRPDEDVRYCVWGWSYRHYKPSTVDPKSWDLCERSKCLQQLLFALTLLSAVLPFT